MSDFLDNIMREQQNSHFKENQKKMVCHFLQKGEILYANDAFCCYFNNKREELIGTNFHRFVYKSDKELIKNHLIGLSKSNPEVIIEYRVITMDGSIQWHRWKKHAIFNENNQIVEIQGIGEDITEKKIAEIERQRLHEEVHEKNQDLEQIIFVASHDLRSPLVNIQGFSKEIEYSLKELNAICSKITINSTDKKRISTIIDCDVTDSLKYIQKSIKKMDSILYGLLKLSRMERAVLNIVNLNISNLISDVLHDFEFILKEKKINIEVGRLPKCKGDPLQINQVFSNLINNSIKYSHPERQGFIKITGRKKDQKVIYCIEDNGIGISEKNLNRIFEIFCRIHPDISHGEGLGLNIVKKILYRHGGKIWVESIKDKGSKFYISMPSI